MEDGELFMHELFGLDLSNTELTASIGFAKGRLQSLKYKQPAK